MGILAHLSAGRTKEQYPTRLDNLSILTRGWGDKGKLSPHFLIGWQQDAGLIPPSMKVADLQVGFVNFVTQHSAFCQLGAFTAASAWECNNKPYSKPSTTA